MKKISIILGIMFLVLAIRAYAVAPPPYKIICHNTPANQVTLSFQNEQSYSGHLGQPHSGSTFDTDGACVEPTGVTPTTVTPTGITPTGITPTGITPTDAQHSPTPTSGITPTVTPTSAPFVPNANSDGAGQPSDGLTPRGGQPAVSAYDGKEVGWK